MAMWVNLENRINNTPLGRTQTLLPLFEAIVNSFQAIEEAGDTDDGLIGITVHREPSQAALAPELDDGRRAAIHSFTVEDNGIGFTDANFRSFQESDTSYKKHRGGKGIGRFLWLKAFSRAQVDSTFCDDGWKVRRFVFSTRDDFGSAEVKPSNEETRRTTITLERVRPHYAAAIPKSLEVIAQRIVEHCIPLFMSPNCPRLTLADEQDTLDLNAYFDRYSAKEATTTEFELKGQRFDLIGLRLREPREKKHSLLFTAHSREVVSRPLGTYLKNLKAKLYDSEGTEYAYLGYVQGPYLDASVNPQRDGFVFAEKPVDGDSLEVELSLQEIAEHAVEIIQQELAEPLENLNRQKEEQIQEFVQMNPRYRILLNGGKPLLDEISPGLSERDLDIELESRLHQKRVEVRQQVHDALQERPDDIEHKQYFERLMGVIAQQNDLGKSALAEYVAHRKVILEFLQAALEKNEATGKYCLEEAVHNLIFPMRRTSDEIDYDDHNLWIIDERFAYHVYLASDKPLKSMEAIDEEKSLLRPDILVFNRAMAYSDDDRRPVTSFTIIEFKRPERTDYQDKGALKQVYGLVDQLRTGQFKGPDGRSVMLASKDVPAYLYVICDITPEVIAECRHAGLRHTPDNLGFFGYNENFCAYTEVISYTKLLADAQKRNKVLFDKLNIGHLKLT